MELKQGMLVTLNQSYFNECDFKSIDNCILLRLTKREIKRYGYCDRKGKLLKEGLYPFTGLVWGRNPFKSNHYCCYFHNPVKKEDVTIIRNDIHGLTVDKLCEILNLY